MPPMPGVFGDEEKYLFDLMGYLVIEDALSLVEVATLNAELERTADEQGGMQCVDFIPSGVSPPASAIPFQSHQCSPQEPQDEEPLLLPHHRAHQLRVAFVLPADVVVPPLAAAVSRARARVLLQCLGLWVTSTSISLHLVDSHPPQPRH